MNEQETTLFQMMKERALDSLGDMYEQIIRIKDGFTDGKWQVDNWQPDEVPYALYRSEEDLIWRYRWHITGAARVCIDVGLLSQYDVDALDNRYRTVRPDIFWPYTSSGGHAALEPVNVSTS